MNDGPLSARQWLALLRPGDWLTIAAGLVICGLLLRTLWQGGLPDKAAVRAGGQLFAELPLDRPRTLAVPGPLGDTLIEIQPGRARVLSDPGPRQYCVRQGWLIHAGSAAICAPNQVSLTLSGRSRDYDSLNY